MKTIKVGLGTCGVSAGGEKVYTALKEEIARGNMPVQPAGDRLHGELLPGGPARDQRREGQQLHVRQRDARQGQEDPGRADPSGQAHRGVDRQGAGQPAARTRSLPSRSASCCATAASSTPNSIEEYIASGGYQALRKVLSEHDPGAGHRGRRRARACAAAAAPASPPA